MPGGEEHGLEVSAACALPESVRLGLHVALFNPGCCMLHAPKRNTLLFTSLEGAAHVLVLSYQERSTGASAS